MKKWTSPLCQIPVELLVIVLKNLPDFDSLSATIRTCRYLCNCFINSDADIITSIISNIYQRTIRLNPHAMPFSNRDSCLIIQQLSVAITESHIRRDFVLQMFEDAWNFLLHRKLDELLIPLGRELACSLDSENRRHDAITLLNQILDGQPPFQRSSTKPPLKSGYPQPASTWHGPLISLLARFDQEVEMNPEAELKKQLQLLPIALITDDGMLFFESVIHLPEGIYRESGITFIKLANIPRPWRVHSSQEMKEILPNLPDATQALSLAEKDPEPCNLRTR